MKRIFIFVLSLIAANNLHAQITITQTDLPVAGNSYVMSNGDPSGIQLSDLDQNGANQNWSFNLQSTGQQTDVMFSLSDVPLTYLVFLQADYADNTAPDFSLPIPGFPLMIENIYNFYNLTSNSLQQIGMGATVNGFELPIFFNPQDLLYQLPLNYNDTYSSVASFSANVPTFGGWFETRDRNNTVDGWGTLDGPLGTQQVLRVKSVINYTDSLSIDAIPFPIPAIPREETEYKWLTLNGGVPILEIVTTNNIITGESVSRVKYRDVPNGIEETLANNQAVTLYPQPATNNVVIVNPYANDANVEVILSDATGRVIMNNIVPQSSLLNLDVSAYPAGIYMLTLQSESKSFTRRVAVTR